MAGIDIGAVRRENVQFLSKRGFKVSATLPTKRPGVGKLRREEDVVQRLMALGAVFMWASAWDASDDEIRAHARKHALRDAMTKDERAIFKKERPAARSEHVQTIGSKLENMWSLAWVLGYRASPQVDGKMIEPLTARMIVFEMIPTLPEAAKLRPLEEIVRLEDRFYCCHDAVRRAQIGGTPCPAASIRSRTAASCRSAGTRSPGASLRAPPGTTPISSREGRRRWGGAVDEGDRSPVRVHCSA